MPVPPTENRFIAGRYRQLRVLGRGGMGVVYCAHDERLGRTVAIKTLNDTLSSNAEARQLFLEEGRQLATLSHPNLVAVFDATTEDGQDLLISEFVEGQNLDELLANGPLDLPTALSVAIQITEGITYLHTQGVIHRDIKPANVMLKPDGCIKIIDFGLARSLDQIMQKGTQMRGTPAYMAPEQLFGPGPSEATDVYQLAVTFYLLLSAEFPFEINEKAAWAHLNEPVFTTLQQRIPAMPAQLSNILQACLVKDPTARPSTLELLTNLIEVYQQLPPNTIPQRPLPTGSASALLARINTERSLSLIPPTAPPTTSSPPPKHLFLLLAIISAAILVALAVVVFIALEPEKPTATSATPTTTTILPIPEKPSTMSAPKLPDTKAYQAAQTLAAQQIVQSLQAASTHRTNTQPPAPNSLPQTSRTPKTTTKTPTIPTQTAPQTAPQRPLAEKTAEKTTTPTPIPAETAPEKTTETATTTPKTPIPERLPPKPAPKPSEIPDKIDLKPAKKPTQVTPPRFF